VNIKYVNIKLCEYYIMTTTIQNELPTMNPTMGATLLRIALSFSSSFAMFIGYTCLLLGFVVGSILKDGTHRRF